LKQKIALVISDIDRWQAFEWVAGAMHTRYHVSFVLLTHKGSFFEDFLRQRGFEVFVVRKRAKIFLPVLIFQVSQIFNRTRPNTVHTHFLDANLVGLTAAFICGVPKRIYTRHHSVFHQRFQRKGILYDKWANLISTKIIAISCLVKDVLVNDENVAESKIKVIRHGFDFGDFYRIKNSIGYEFIERNDLGRKGPIIGVVSRYIEWKGIHYIITAFKEVLYEFPNACLVLMNAKGPFVDVIKFELSEIAQDSYREIPFEKNMLAVYPHFDVFVHTPIDAEVEAFGQVYVESLASGLPSVFTASGIAAEIIKHEREALLVPFRNSNAVKEAILRILGDNALCEKLKRNGWQRVETSFSLTSMMNNLFEMYDQ
jgi:glycosyltransferase involved in cell wall biosynthesis